MSWMINIGKTSQLAGNLLIQACKLVLRPRLEAQCVRRHTLFSRPGRKKEAEVVCWQMLLGTNQCAQATELRVRFVFSYDCFSEAGSQFAPPQFSGFACLCPHPFAVHCTLFSSSMLIMDSGLCDWSCHSCPFSLELRFLEKYMLICLALWRLLYAIGSFTIYSTNIY